MPGVKSPLAGRQPGDIDFWVVRENNEGEYSDVGGVLNAGGADEACIQETRFTLGEIGAFLKENNLNLLGFEIDTDVLAAYRRRFPQDLAATDLSNWQEFEADHPDIFIGMYSFWVQKVA